MCESGSRVVAFVLAFGPGVDYDSPNYRYFDAGAPDFIYIDRVVVDHAHQRAGLGDALYSDLLGSQSVSGGSKRVSLRELTIG